MKWFKSLLIITGLAITLLGGSVGAQMTGTTYTLTSGTYVGGGGMSSSATYAVTGVAPLAGAGILTGSNYTAVSGTPGIAYSFATLQTFYDGSSVMTVANDARTLKVAYSGSSGTAAGVFYYRQGGATSYQSAAMSQGTGDTLTYALPASFLTLRGLEYYFEITRGIYISQIGVPTFPLVFRVQLDNSEAQSTATPANQYRIVGLPIAISGSNSAASVFEDDLGEANTSVWRLGNYDATTGDVKEFPDADVVIPGRGYWLITAEAETFGAAGVSVRPNRSLGIPGSIGYYEVPLDSGWNQLANPFAFNVAWNDILFEAEGTVVSGHPPEVLEDSAYSYTGTGSRKYVTYRAIPAWQGVFVKIEQDNVTALIPYDETSLTPTKPTPEKDAIAATFDSWTVRLELKAGDFTDNANFIGVRPDALDGRDRYDFSEPPPAPSAPCLAIRIPDDGDNLRRSDYRPPFNDGATWDIEITKASDRVLTVLGLNQMPAGFEALLITDGGEKIALSEGMQIGLPENLTGAKLIIGDPAYTTGEISSLLPDDYALEQNFPNPFNSSTTVRFALPAGGPTRLEIYNILGQTVKALLNEELSAGYHAVEWNGTDNHGGEVATGVYFYRIVSGNFTAYKKMLLLK